MARLAVKTLGGWGAENSNDFSNRASRGNDEKMPPHSVRIWARK